MSEDQLTLIITYAKIYQPLIGQLEHQGSDQENLHFVQDPKAPEVH